jgi:hypothetical protein
MPCTLTRNFLTSLMHYGTIMHKVLCQSADNVYCWISKKPLARV